MKSFSLFNYFKNILEAHQTKKDALTAITCLYDIIEEHMIANQAGGSNRVNHGRVQKNKFNFLNLLKKNPAIVKDRIYYERSGVGIYRKEFKRKIHECLVESAIKTNDLVIIETTIDAMISMSNQALIIQTDTMHYSTLAYKTIGKLDIFKMVIEKGGILAQEEYTLLKQCKLNYDPFEYQKSSGLYINEGQEGINKALEIYEAYLEKSMFEETLVKHDEKKQENSKNITKKYKI
jgi:hypothetical protein